MRKILLLVVLISFSLQITAQKNKPNRGTFIEYKPGFYQNSILKDIRAVDKQQKSEKKHKYFKLDYSGIEVPNKKNLYKSQWHFKPISQGNTGTCWCFSTISFFESEVYRLQKKEVKLSEMYIVYWEYVEKAREFVKTRGESAFPEGSEANAVTRMFKLYGAVPESEYSGKPANRVYHTHKNMKKEMDNYLHWVKENDAWNEKEVLGTIKSIMNHYMGVPPTEFEWDGNKYTPETFLKNAVKINPDDYVDVVSYMQQPYWEQVEYEVPDNWWHSEEYYNVPLDVYMKIL